MCRGKSRALLLQCVQEATEKVFLRKCKNVSLISKRLAYSVEWVDIAVDAGGPAFQLKLAVQTRWLTTKACYRRATTQRPSAIRICLLSWINPGLPCFNLQSSPVISDEVNNQLIPDEYWIYIYSGAGATGLSLLVLITVLVCCHR